MKFSNFSRVFTAGIFVWLLTISAAAQDTGGSFGSYTWIDYDETTNIVTAYSQTDSDYNLMGDYEARVSLTVTNDYGVIVASGSGYDDGYGYATVELSFAGEPDRTYTAVGTHRAFAYLYDYDYDYEYYDYPYYRPVYYYYDNWYFTGFEGGSIYQPWYYSFYRPSYNYFRRRTRTISLGRTYDSVSTTVPTPAYRGSFQAQGPDINYGSRQDFGDGVIADGNTVSWSWARFPNEQPLTLREGVEALRLINSHLTPTQQDNRKTDAFPCARDFINRCTLNKGCDPRSTPRGGMQCQDKNGAHVDVVIYKGLNFQK